MNRIKAYIGYLLIPAIPSLLMIFSPETVDPVFDYLANGKGNRYVWVLIFGAFLFSIYFGLFEEAKAINTKPSLVLSIKWYLLLVGCLVSAYILLFNNPVPKYAFFGTAAAVFSFYLFMVSSHGRNT